MCCSKRTAKIALFASIFSCAPGWAQSPGSNLKPPESTAASDTSKSPSASVRPQEYLVGESDVLNVNVWKEPEVTQTVVVRTDGYISLPLINEVKVSGMTPVQIQDLIATKLKAYMTSPQVTVTVTEIRSKRAFITGEVARPGGYSLNTETSVLQLIAQAGGLTAYAKRENITVLRFENGKQQRLPFRYKEVVQGKNTEQNVALRPGDIVVVP
jgi:polysaccharide export outer membrane protein